MALSDRHILEEIQKGNIIIDPFIMEDLATSSYDVRLGEWYYQEQKPLETHDARFKIFNPYNKSDVDHVWGMPQRAKPLEEVLKEYNIPQFLWDEEDEGIALDDLIILIAPHETILAHTINFIGGINCITTSMQARSSQGRSFIEVCKCAGWGDVGYINRWTMEITNNSQYYTIPLVVGRRYAQIVFSDTGPILEKQYGDKGKYQSGSNLEEIKEAWTPDMMVPKLYLDRDRKRK